MYFQRTLQNKGVLASGAVLSMCLLWLSHKSITAQTLAVILEESKVKYSRISSTYIKTYLLLENEENTGYFGHCVCVFMYMLRYTFMCMHVEARGQPWMLLHGFALFWYRVSQWPGAHRLRQVGFLVSKAQVPLSAASSVAYKCVPSFLAFFFFLVWVQGLIKFWLSTLY